MNKNIPNIKLASLYARTENQKLVREILRIEGVRSLNMMYKEI